MCMHIIHTCMYWDRFTTLLLRMFPRTTKCSIREAKYKR